MSSMLFRTLGIFLGTIAMAIPVAADELTLVLDDGTCEGVYGFYPGDAFIAMSDFDVPAGCEEGGLEILGIEARLGLDSGPAPAVIIYGEGATPGAYGTGIQVDLAEPFLGPEYDCGSDPSTVETRIFDQPVYLAGGTNFYVGILLEPGPEEQGWAARDIDSPDAGRMWIDWIDGGQMFTPDQLEGNLMLRVIVDDSVCGRVDIFNDGFEDGTTFAWQ